MQSPVLLGIGVRFVARVDDRTTAGRRRRDRLPDVFGALTHRVRGALGVGDDLAGAGEDLAADEVRDEDLLEPGEVIDALDAVVLVTAVGVAGRVGVVLEQVDVTADTFVAELTLGVLDELAQDRLAGLVLGDGVDERVALGRGVLRVRADVEVEATAVLQEHVARASPRDDLAKEESTYLVGTESSLPAQRKGDPVLGLDAVDASQHGVTLADSSAKELADLVVVQSRERASSAAVLEDPDLEVTDFDDPVRSGERADRVLQRGRQ